MIEIIQLNKYTNTRISFLTMSPKNFSLSLNPIERNETNIFTIVDAEEISIFNL